MRTSLIKLIMANMIFMGFNWKAIASNENLKVFGFTHYQVVQFDGDPNGTACSSQHLQNDLSNRWCHSLFVKLLDQKLQSKNVPKFISAILAGSIFIPKEYWIDKKPSMADLGIADYELFSDENKIHTISISAFLDGAFIVNISKQF